jgi:hypothetical protein
LVRFFCDRGWHKDFLFSAGFLHCSCGKLCDHWSCHVLKLICGDTSGYIFGKDFVVCKATCHKRELCSCLRNLNKILAPVAF